MKYHKRVNIDMYVDVKGTEKEMFEEINDLIMRTVAEFHWIDILMEPSAWRNIHKNENTDCKYYEYPSYEYQNKILDEEE